MARTSAGVGALRVLAAPTPHPGETWTAFVTRHLDDEWRPGEWQAEAHVFAGDQSNPRTIAYGCLIPGCGSSAVVKNGHCARCRKAVACGETPAAKPTEDVACRQVGVPGCQRIRSVRGLCRRHYAALHKAGGAKWSGAAVTAWAMSQAPLHALGGCDVAGCPKQRAADNTVLCRAHHGEARRLDVDPRVFAVRARRVLPAHHFTLEYCSETMRAEILYGLQRRDMAEFSVPPFVVRNLMPHIESCGSLLDVDTSVLPRKGAQFVDNLRPYVAELHDRYTGTDVLAGDVWPPHAEFLFPTSQERRVVPRTGWDWCEVDCLWLRDLGKRYVADTLPRREDVTQYLRACKAASASLRAAPAFDDRTQADLRHMTRIVKDLETIRDLSYTEATRMAGRLKQVLLHCRTSGYMVGIPEGFAFHAMHQMRKQNKTQPYEEPGDAIPEDVIAFLDDNLASFKPNLGLLHG